MSEFDEYIRQGEPGRSEKAAAWQTAIGLQDVDGLKPSKYLIETAKKHIEGDITIDDVKSMLNSYYSSKGTRDEIEHERTEEADSSFLIAFLRNLILGEHNELRNRSLHVDFPKVNLSQNAESECSKSKSCTLNCTLEELAVLNFLSDNPKATQKQVAAHIRKSERTAKSLTVKLQQGGLLERKNGRRDGYWEIKVQL